MKYLVILKRFEIWLLLAVVGFVFYSAFRTDPTAKEEEVLVEETVAVVDGAKEKESTKNEAESDTAEAGQETPDFRVESIRVDSDSNAGRIVEVTLLARSDSGAEVLVDETSLRAETETGAVVPYFFSPFQARQVVDPKEPSLVTVRFWLEQPAEKIRLFFEGEQAEADLAAEEVGS